MNSPSHWRLLFDSRSDLLTPSLHGWGLNYLQGWISSVCCRYSLCLQADIVTNLFSILCLSLAGLCPPLEKCLLRLRAHSSTWILLHHSPQPSEQHKAAHPLLRRYSRGATVDDRSSYLSETVSDFCLCELLYTGKDETHCWGWEIRFSEILSDRDLCCNEKQ